MVLIAAILCDCEAGGIPNKFRAWCHLKSLACILFSQDTGGKQSQFGCSIVNLRLPTFRKKRRPVVQAETKMYGWLYVPRNLLIIGHVYLLRGILFKDAIVSTARLQNMLENLVVLAGLVQSLESGLGTKA